MVHSQEWRGWVSETDNKLFFHLDTDTFFTKLLYYFCSGICVQSYSLPNTESSRTFAIKEITTCSSWCTIWKQKKLNLYVITRKQGSMNCIPNLPRHFYMKFTSAYQLQVWQQLHVFPLLTSEEHNRGWCTSLNCSPCAMPMDLVNYSIPL